MIKRLVSRRRLAAALAVLGIGGSAVSAARASADSMASFENLPVKELRFRDFFRMPIGPKGLETTEALRRADGQVVRLVGYMVQRENDTPGSFMLTPIPVQMSEHADGDADDLPATMVLVRLDPSQRDWLTSHTPGLVAVSGLLRVGRHEEVDGRVVWVRMQLDPSAIRRIDDADAHSH